MKSIRRLTWAVAACLTLVFAPSVFAKDDEKQADSFDKAHDAHLKVLNALHEMTGRYDAVKSLDQAADRFEKQVKEQLQLHVQSGQALRDLIESVNPKLDPAMRILLNK